LGNGKETGMDTRCLRILAIGVLLLGLLSGCAATAASRADLGGLPNADHPEYMVHPLRVVGLGFYFVGNLGQYLVLEPGYFLLAPIPEAVGLSLEERRYLAQRKEAWSGYLAGERPYMQ
jgi:hypothetical protein